MAKPSRGHSKTEDLQEQIQKCCEPLATSFAEFLQTFQDSESLVTDPLYSLPERLLELIQQYLPGWLSTRELAFERGLADLCQRNASIGMYRGNPIVFQPLQEIQLPVPSRAEFEELGWAEFMSYEEVLASFELAPSRLEPVYSQCQAYLGWLVTNPEYVSDLEEIENQRERSDEQYARECEGFRAKWQLTKLVTRDLPLPQLPNLSGFELPAHTRHQSHQVRIEMPVTMRLPARYGLAELIDEIRAGETPPHLRHWQQILDRADSSQPGMQRYRHLFRLHFYRNVVLASRYSAKLTGKTAALDAAFGGFLDGLGEDSVKKLRLFAERRLRGSCD